MDYFSTDKPAARTRRTRGRRAAPGFYIPPRPDESESELAFSLGRGSYYTLPARSYDAPEDAD